MLWLNKFCELTGHKKSSNIDSLCAQKYALGKTLSDYEKMQRL